MASQSHSVRVRRRRRVRSSSNCTCGRWRRRNQWSCSRALCSPARVSQVVVVAWRCPNTRAAAAISSPSDRAVSTSATRREAVLSWSQRRTASGAKSGFARLAAEGLNALVLPVRAITNQRVDMRVRDAVIDAGGGRTREAVGGNAFGRTPATFDLAPGADGWACAGGRQEGSGWRQAGQSSGVRGLSSRRTDVVTTVLPGCAGW